MTNGNGQEAVDTDAPVAITVEPRGDKVVVQLSRSRTYFAMPAHQASVLAEQLARCAFQVHYQKPAADRGSELARQVKAKAVDEIRPRIIARVTQILRSMIHDKKEPTRIAEHVVDATLKEIV